MDVNEPHSWFREESERKVTSIEAINAPLFSRGRVKDYRCTLLDRECSYIPNTGAGDCRQCIFALAFLSANPQYVMENIGAKR